MTFSHIPKVPAEGKESLTKNIASTLLYIIYSRQLDSQLWTGVFAD
jgi:hypothetical protein